MKCYRNGVGTEKRSKQQGVKQPSRFKRNRTENMVNSTEKRILEGEFHTAANGHKTYEIFSAAPSILFEISNILIAKFGFTQLDLPIIGLDEVITQCRKGNIELGLGWDIWSGFYVMANSFKGDELIQEIGTYLDTIIGGKDFEKYVHNW